MSLKLNIAILLVALILLFITLRFLKMGKIPIKYSLIWFFIILVLLILSIFPQILEFFQSAFGFRTLSNMVIGILITLLIMVCIVFTVIVSEQNKKIVLLIQEVSLLKQKGNEYEE